MRCDGWRLAAFHTHGTSKAAWVFAGTPATEGGQWTRSTRSTREITSKPFPFSNGHMLRSAISIVITVSWVVCMCGYMYPRIAMHGYSSERSVTFANMRLEVYLHGETGYQ